MIESGWEALSVVWEWSGDPFECPGCPPGYPGVVERPTRFYGSGREALLDVWEWWEALPNVQESSWMCGRPSRTSKSGWVALPNVRE